MKPTATSDRPLHYTQTASSLLATSQPANRWAGIGTGLGLLAFITMFMQNAVAKPNVETITSAVGASFVTLLCFGIIPAVLLRRQRITLNHVGLESRFFLVAVPVWRNFIPLDNLVKIDSIWDGGSDEGSCARLLIQTKAGETKWGIDASDAVIEVLAKRLSQCLRELRNQPITRRFSVTSIDHCDDT